MTARARVFGWSAERLAALVIVVYVVCVAIGFAPVDPAVREVWGWPVPGAAVVLLSQLWPGGTRWRFSVALTALWVVFVVLGGVMGVGWLRAAAWGAAELGLIAGVLAGYRRWVSPLAWFPERPRQLAGLAGLTVLGGIAAAGLAAAGLGPADYAPDGPELMIWYAAGWCTRVSIGAVIGLAWAHPMHEWVGMWHPWVAGVGIPLSLTGLLVAGLNPGLPLMWLALVPALVIGLTTTPRWGAFAASGLGVLVWAAPHVYPGWSAADDPMRPAALQLTALVSVLFAMGLVLLRDHNARLDEAVVTGTRRSAARSAVVDAMIAAMADGVLIADRHGELLLANPAARALLGPPVAAGEPESEPTAGWAARYTLLGEEGRPLRPGEIAALEAPGEAPVRVALAVPTAGGDLQELQATAQRIAARDDATALVVLSDVTHQRERRRELEAFAGVVAHDLRNPLGAVSLWLDAAAPEVERDPAEALAALRKAQSASARMRQVIEDYLAYAVGREGVLRLEDVDLAEVVAAAAAPYVGAGPHTGAGLHAGVGLHAGPAPVPSIESSARGLVRADEALLRQVFANLIGNAIKYARPGETPYIRVRARIDDPPGWVRILVSDKGVGIDDGDLETMFAPFGRTARGAAVGEGTGLGLPLCRSIVSRHGGTITARPNSWGGTTIELLLPRGGASIVPTAPEPPESPERLTAAARQLSFGRGRRP